MTKIPQQNSTFPYYELVGYMMKLREITEAYTQAQIQDIATEETVRNLIVSSLMKVRNMLVTLGLTKSGDTKNRIIEPIGPAATPFATLRNVIQQRAKRDGEIISRVGLNNKRVDAIERFWGFKMPSRRHGIDAGISGRATVQGQFDDLLRNAVQLAQNKPIEGKIRVLQQLAKEISQAR